MTPAGSELAAAKAGDGRPAVVVVDRDAGERETLYRELSKHYGADYRIVACDEPAAPGRWITRLAAAGTSVTLVIGGVGEADPDGIDVLVQVRAIDPTVVLVAAVRWGEWDTARPVFEAITVGKIDHWVRVGYCHHAKSLRGPAACSRFTATLAHGLRASPTSHHTVPRIAVLPKGTSMNSLLVGVGISDRAAPGDDPAADAVTAEALGYDFVSAFDHPVADAFTAETVGYDRMPAGHPVRTYPTYETQTLLTWIAARTTRIGIVPRVLGVPFRRPALIAKAAESLQRLSGGRLILGLGAGYRDQEIRAAGAPDLIARAKMDGLADAIAIMQAAWTQPVVSYHGAVYSAEDLDLEPKPAKPIPIWLGAAGPRGLALTGRLADGWIPFLRFTGPDRIPALLDQIRAASAAAGRPADAVRATYSVPVRLDPKARTTAGVIAGSAADITDQLHAFTELGFTGFDLMPSRDQIRAIAEDVVPALRELRVLSQYQQFPPVTTIHAATHVRA